MLSILTPAFNEAANLETLHSLIVKTMTQLGGEWEWIIVDDHSQDATFAVIERLAAADSHVRGIRLARNSGSHVAISCALHQVRGDAAVMLAADLQDPPALLGAMRDRWRGGAQVVWATRRERTRRGSNAIFAGFFYWIMRHVVGLKDLPARGADCFLVDRVVIDAVRSFPERNVSVLALITWLGFRQEQIEYDKQPRAAGRSGWTLQRKITLVLDSVTGFSDAPVRMCSYLGIALIALGLVLAAYALVPPRSGVGLLLAAVTGLAGLQLAALGMVGEYVWRALDEVRGRPAYLIEAIAGADQSPSRDREIGVLGAGFTARPATTGSPVDSRGPGVDPASSPLAPSAVVSHARVEDPRAAKRWTRLSYGYAALVVAGIAYFLVDLPVQVTDSYGNIVKAAQGTLGSLVYGEFYQEAYLRPLGWAQLRIVYDLSGGHYFEWFRGWHVAQVALLAVLFLRLVRPRSVSGAAAVALGLAALIGMHTFAGTVREAFPLNMFMTVLICAFVAADLALGPPRWWRDVAAALLLVFAAFSVESGLLVAVVFVAAFLAGARGISRVGVAIQVLLVVGYLVLRFAILQVGSPGLEERQSGFGFSALEPDELIEKFGSRPLPFYAYNVVSSGLSILFSEPRAGTWRVTRAVLEGEPATAGLVNVTASTLGTLLIGVYAWRRRHEWWARRFDRSDQLVLIFIAVAGANAAISYAYTKDVILSPAGAFFALALAVATRHFIDATRGLSALRAMATALLLVVLSGAWAFRVIDAHLGLREAAAAMHGEWAYVDMWLEQEDQVPTDPAAVALKQHLQDDAISRHPLRPTLTADWLEWFEND
jgi:polyisoprenyl-phosphate glycosyltransferase